MTAPGSADTTGWALALFRRSVFWGLARLDALSWPQPGCKPILRARRTG